MSYVKQTWQTGDVVTSAKLNHMEDGIAAGGGSGGGGATIVHVALDSQGSGSLDMTAGEILAAAQTGPMILVEIVEGYGVIGAGPLGISRNQTGVFSVLSASGLQYTAASADDYPSHSGGG